MDPRKLLIDVCKRDRLKKIPRLTICKGTVAEARLRTIRIGRKLLPLLADGEMEGVVAHEVHHVKRLTEYTILTIVAEGLSMIALLVAGTLTYLFLVNAFPTLISYSPPSAFRAIMALSIALLWLALNRHISRMKELRADRFAASIVGSKAYTKALKKVYSIPSKPKLLARIWEWLNPHPSLEKRLEAIRNAKRLPYPARQPTSIKGKAETE